MRNGFSAGGGCAAASETISFGECFTKSEQFDRVFKEGMTLVERTAAYLDGPGRSEAKRLKSPLSVTYATESMRLTTRLLELASWLLIRRAIKNDEISTHEAAAKRARIKLGGGGRPGHIRNFDELPAGLRELIEESFQLTDRIVQLDRSLSQPTPPQPNAVAEQLARIEHAFGGRSSALAKH